MLRLGVKILLVFGLLLALQLEASPQERFLGKYKLANGMTVVVSEGDFEARSIGSYTLRTYQAAQASEDTTFFVTGLVASRGGVIEKVLLADVNYDLLEEVIVCIRSVGTGGYLDIHAYAVGDSVLESLIVLEGIESDADPLTVLVQALAK